MQCNACIVLTGLTTLSSVEYHDAQFHLEATLLHDHFKSLGHAATLLSPAKLGTL